MPQYKVVDYMMYMENHGYKVELQLTEENTNGIQFSIVTHDGDIHFQGTIGPKALGEYIKLNATEHRTRR